MVSFEIRAALPGDEEQLLAVARHLNSVNLPNDRSAIHEIVDMSHRSHSGAIQDPRLRQYVFVLVDVGEGTPKGGTIIGTSMLIAQLGRRNAPYIYFDVLDEEKYSATIDKHFHHTVLRIGYSYNGPTEIGGLVLMPTYRQRAEKLGTMISYVRFLYLAAHRDLFQDEILAELLPPLEPDGTSHLWEALGHKFVDLSYAEADLLSKKNKEFIKGLFPEGTIYASLLPLDAQRVIGKTGTQTRGVEKLLRRIGFRYAHRVDPFDGGPHYTARMDEISLVQETRRTRADRPFTPLPGDRQALIAITRPEPPYFRAVMAHFRDEGSKGIAVADDAWEHLQLRHTSPVIILHIP
ncbi:arginine N-succinyltransferase [Chondromyces apiculatus]|uniref:Arginine N-succinyltransferase n=1 Tax=Chondromyces apiculatus DSM 436 TaxID=1192034 RepID=A0A017T1G6_9BACT|nr:arginine N-succinyltransferase [Chondromyces apiculatus]EYF02411.1 Arginine N-succinyltransferase [Chondromyces apiculatus DSM 436]